MSEDEPTAAETDETDREENMRRYRKAYWERFAKTRKRVYGTLTKDEYDRIEARAKEAGRAVWAQVHAEAEAYARGEFLPPKEIEERITDLIVQLRRIGNNINQITRTMHADGAIDRMSLHHNMVDLEDRIRDFTAKPWGALPEDDDDDTP